MSVLTLTEAKNHLNITSTTQDAELVEFIEAAEAAIGEKCGPLESVAQTERVVGGGTGLVLRHTPVVSLTSVTPLNGTAYDIDLLTVDNSAGVIEWNSGVRFAVGRYDVVYQAGRASVPGDLLMGVKELTRHLWETQRGPSRRPGSNSGDSTANTLAGAAHIMVFRVMELISPHIQVGN